MSCESVTTLKAMNTGGTIVILMDKQILCQDCYMSKSPWGRLNIKMSSYQYRDSHVKDKTVSPTVLSLTWESPYLGKTVFILRRGPCFGLSMNFVRPVYTRSIWGLLLAKSYFLGSPHYTKWQSVRAVEVQSSFPEQDIHIY